jgi:ketosteroid isomerase-like protein
MSGYSGKFSGPVGFIAQRSLLIRACGGDSTKKRWNPKQTKSLKALNEGGSVNRMARRNELDDRYAINAAKTELREGYKNADVERILSVYADAFTDMSDGQATFFGPDAKVVLRARLEKLFDEYQIEFTPIIIAITIAGMVAVEYGWHELTLRPKAGGPAELKRTRYVEVWNRDRDNSWQIVLFIDNIDQKPELAEDQLLKLGSTAVTEEQGKR